ncbi:MAG: radical SAM family heme chaperone HemW [Planctomycetia bacterium]|nr:radical SAM family heme chaperone HemW [Planctomycetia bacterium]
MPPSVLRPPTAAYLHVPFCRHRCGYCNFTLIAGRDDLIEAYLAGLAIELAQLVEPRPVATLFLGGGTPTHLAPPQLEQLVDLARRWFPLTPGYEFSAEANPSDVTPERIAVLHAAGLTRLSLGVQSFRAEKLRALERDHTAAIARQAVRLAQDAGFSTSLDLIFGAPQETLDDWRSDLDAALALETDHVSLYGLTFERGTSFWTRKLKGELQQSDEELERAMYLEAIDRLTAAGYEHYEVSNFARPGRRCRHNETYWAAHGYYAAGPGAARYVDGRRETNHRSTTTWLQRIQAGQSPVADSETLAPEDRAREALVLGLRRLPEGIEARAFAEEFGYDLSSLGGDELGKLLASDLLQLNEGRLRLTREGLLISDWIWSKFVRC